MKLRPEVSCAIGEWNERHYGRRTTGTLEINDPEVLERLAILAFDEEDLNDTILRLLKQGGTALQ